MKSRNPRTERHRWQETERTRRRDERWDPWLGPGTEEGLGEKTGNIEVRPADRCMVMCQCSLPGWHQGNGMEAIPGHSVWFSQIFGKSKIISKCKVFFKTYN